MSNFAEFKYLEDFDEIESFLEKDPEGFEVPFDPPPFVPDFGSAIIVDNIPVIGPDRVEKLKGVLSKLYAQINPQEEFKLSDIYMPFDDVTKQTMGFCFIKFKSKEDADKAVQITQGFQLDKKHHFNVTLYADLDKYASVPDEYVPPESQAFRPRPNPLSWLTDPMGRDQFVLRYGDETEICWASLIQGEDPVHVYGGEREKLAGLKWTEMSVQWSPQGTFLVTFHAQGVKLWGGEEFEPQGRFIHPFVETVEFSPCERYLITCRFDQSRNQNPLEAIIVWDVREQKKLRTFELKSPLDAKFQVSIMLSVADRSGKLVERAIRGRIVDYSADYGTFKIAEGNVTHENIPMDKVQPLQDPNRLKWSPDGRFVARMGCDNILVYELPSMALLDKKSIAAKDVLDFVWSPKSNMISYWSPAVGNYPAMINILELPERKDICSRKVFDVQDGQMVWQSDGDFLCVHMTKTQNKKRSYVLMMFRVREPEVPVEILEVADPILHMSWEPSNERFAIVTGEQKTLTVSFYGVGGTTPAGGAKGAKGRKELVLLFSLTGRQCNEVIWSPAGGVAAIVYFAPDACLFDLHDVENNVALASRRHDRCNRLVWDPSGRMIASATLSAMRGPNVRGHSEDGVNVYTFQGNLLCQCRREKLYQMQWRPRPAEVLSSEERKKIVKNLRKYEKIFDREDDARREQLDTAVVAKRRELASEFLAVLWQRQAENARLKSERVALRDGYDSDDDRYYDVEIQIEETILSTKEQIIN